MIELKINGVLYARTERLASLRNYVAGIIGPEGSEKEHTDTFDRLVKQGYTAVLHRKHGSVMLSTNDDILVKFHRDWVNNFISTAAFAAHYSISEDSAQTLLRTMEEAV